jgi:phage/plasmid-associated DNA primase
MGGRSLSSEQLRALVSEQSFSARKMHQDAHEITATHTFHVTQNNPPPLSQLDPSTKRRLLVHAWDVIVDKPDDTLSETLELSLDYVLLNIINGYHAWDVEEIDRGDTEAYFGNNRVYACVHECFVESRDALVSTDQAFAIYKRWCNENGEKTVTETAFGISLSKMGYSKTRRSVDGVKRVVRLGIRPI